MILWQKTLIVNKLPVPAEHPQSEVSLSQTSQEALARCIYSPLYRQSSVLNTAEILKGLNKPNQAVLKWTIESQTGLAWKGPSPCPNSPAVVRDTFQQTMLLQALSNLVCIFWPPLSEKWPFSLGTSTVTAAKTNQKHHHNNYISNNNLLYCNFFYSEKLASSAGPATTQGMVGWKANTVILPNRSHGWITNPTVL